MDWGQKAPTHKGKLFWESNYIDGSHISQFLAHFRKFSILGLNVIKYHRKIGLSSIKIQNFEKIGWIVQNWSQNRDLKYQLN